MHKLTRSSLAVLLSLSIASAGVMSAYAEETTKDYSAAEAGFDNAIPSAEDEQLQETPSTAETNQLPAADPAAQEEQQPAADPAAQEEQQPAADPAAQGEQQPAADPAVQEEQQPAAAPAAQEEQQPAADPAVQEEQQPAANPLENITFSSDEEASARAHQRTKEFGSATPYITAAALRADNHWTPSFVGDDMIHNHGTGWSSMKMSLKNSLGNLLYRTYSSSTGWSEWFMNGEETVHLTNGAVVEAVQVRMAGIIYNNYDVYYRATLSDGTILDWAKNGQTSGSIAQNKWLVGFQMMLFPKNTEFPHATAKTVDSPAGTDGVQFKLGALPTYKDGSGNPYTGWGWIENQRFYFVNDQAVTGWQYIDGFKYFFDDHGTMVSDLRGILGNAAPYILKINLSTNTLTVYAKDGENGYILPVVSFLTTTGSDTPTGTFNIPEKYRWRLMYGNVYTQYAMRLRGGYMIHSIIFKRQNPYTLKASTYNNLGTGRSLGCVRLKTGDVKWIYDNCPVGTTVINYKSRVNGPFEAPVLESTIPTSQTYDPTDPTVPEAAAAMQAAAQAQAQAIAEAQAIWDQASQQLQSEVLQNETQQEENQEQQASETLESESETSAAVPQPSNPIN